MDDFLVAVEREVVAVGDDLGLGDEEGLVGALAGFLRIFSFQRFSFLLFPPPENVWEV